MKNEIPGLYLLVGTDIDSNDYRRLGPYGIRHVPGALVSDCENQDAWLGVDGIVTGQDRSEIETDAALALRLYRSGGVAALQELTGFFSLLLIEKRSGQAWLISDLMATRPYYIYEHTGKVVICPDVSFPRRIGLATTLDRQVLYQMFRINHPLGGRCLAGEIERTRAFHCYKILCEGKIVRMAPEYTEQTPDPNLTLDAAADSMHEIASNVLRSILDHPVVRSGPLELPLTAGYDSRHLLGELLALGRPPDRIRHIIVDETDCAPVEEICQEFDLDVLAARFGDLNQKALVHNWLQRTAGQVHLHQLYLFGLEGASGISPTFGLTAYLSGILFSYAPLGTPLHRRHYSRTSLRFLFPDHGRLSQEFDDHMNAEFDRFRGEEGFRLLAVDAVNRSPRYAGAVFTKLGKQTLYFAPAAEENTWAWFCRVPAALAWRQKARIRLFERHFPELGRFPLRDGLPLIRPRQGRALLPVPPRFRRARARSRPRITVPPTPHAWLRRHETLRCLADRVVRESKLCQNEEISSRAARLLWTALQNGAFAGWPLMSLISTEAAYRIMILGEDPDETADFLTV